MPFHCRQRKFTGANAKLLVFLPINSCFFHFVCRVYGPLQNSEEFAKAFQCPVGTRMNPKKKCAVW